MVGAGPASRTSRSAGVRAIGMAAAAAAVAGWIVAAVFAAVDHRLVTSATGVAVLAFAAVGAVVVWRRPEHRLGWLFCAAALMLGVMGGAEEYARHALLVAPGSLPGGAFAAWLSDAMAMPTIGLLVGVLPQLFPTGRPVSSRWRVPVWAAFAYIALGAAGNDFAAQRLENVPIANPYAIRGATPVFGVMNVLAAACGLVAIVAGVVTLVLRWRRSHGEERQQLKWFLAGIGLLPLPVLLHSLSPAVSDAAISIVLVLVPVTMGVAVMRHRLYDLDLVVNRAIVYALVSASVAGVYLTVIGVGEVAVGGVSLGGHVIAAVVAGAALQPVRAWVQRAVDRVFYGDRSRPYEAVARLGRRLEHALDPETVLPGVVETVADALRVPYAGIELRHGDAWTLTAAHGEPTGAETAFPMTYQTETIGRLLVADRGRGESFSDADRRLLEDLARHAGVAAHAVRATLALQRSRAELVAAREEERRRVRRDLHDGLGPTLAGVTLGLHAAQVHLRHDPDAAATLLAGIERQIEDAVADVRRLVYGLRPPALDEFGLVRAVQLHASRIESADSLSVKVDAPDDGLGPLPAAVEVAAYRIATEAVTNVVRHASARTCTVRLALNGALEVEVSDDGDGIPADAPAGVGLAAMRERAAELGGSLAVRSTDAGTRLLARLPTAVDAG